jgi:L-threonylcarbamoyladenylate synthase
VVTRKTLHLYAEREDDRAEAARILRRGGLVAFATETVYGLGANALSTEAIAGIFEAKQRPAWDPLIVHVADVARIPEIAAISPTLQARVNRLASLWPGPLTLLLPRRETIPDAVTAGRPLVGIRIPAKSSALELLRLAGVPVAAPSANLFGRTSPTTAQHVLDDLSGRIDAVLDDGPCRLGVESTVVDPSTTPMTVYRPGGVTLAALDAAAGVPAQHFVPEPRTSAMAPEALPSPGVGIRHYAPRARLLLVEDPERWTAEIERHSGSGGARLGIMLPAGWQTGTLNGSILVAPWGDWDMPEALAAGLFRALRSLDARGAEVILCPLPQPGGLRDAIRDRLLKAARAE